MLCSYHQFSDFVENRDWEQGRQHLMQCLFTYNFFTVSPCVSLSWTKSLSAAADNATPIAQGHYLEISACFNWTPMVWSLKCCLILALIGLTMHHHLVNGALEPQLDPPCSCCSNQLQKMCNIVSRLLNTDVFTCTPARCFLVFYISSSF